MADVKLTPEWCEEEADYLAKRGEECIAWGSHVESGRADLRLAEVYRLAARALRDEQEMARLREAEARALRAREWAEAQMVSLAARDYPDNYAAGQECAVADVLAILEGREP